MINHKVDLDKSFQEILYRIDNWTNEGSGWIVESVKSQYINISTFRPLIGNSFIKFEFLVSEKTFSKLEMKSNICINVFCYEN